MSIDPLHTATFTGTVPQDWTRDGWLASLNDRLSRTDCQFMRKVIQDEIAAIQRTKVPRRVRR